MSVLDPMREGRITGSRVAGVLGISPYQSTDDVLREMVRQAHEAPAEFTGNRATDWGNEHEADGVAAWETQNDRLLRFTGDHQRFRQHPIVDFLGVTPDGVTDDGDVVEVKAPLWGGYSVWQDVPWYEAQCRLAAECLDASWVDLVVWRPGGTVVSRVDRDPWWLEQQMPTLEAFMQRYEETVADEALYGPLLAPLQDERDDAAWVDAAARYREAAAVEKIAACATAEAREALLALTDQPARGGGVSVSRSERRGTVDYRKAVTELAPSAELDPWRKPGSTVWTVRVAS